MARRRAPRPRTGCPCGLGSAYPACCGRLHAGAAAPTAELLMRSRYSAFALGDAGYLLATWHPTTRPALLDLDPQQRWTGLQVLETDRGGLLDAEGTVRFRATSAAGALEELSRFVRDAGRWSYLGPIVTGTPAAPPR